MIGETLRRARSRPRRRAARLGVAAAIGSGIAVLLTSLAATAAPAQTPERGRPAEPLRPVIFVHGGSGSGAQFESHGMRLTSNGYPADRVNVLEYDSTFGTNTMADVHARLDALIAEELEQSGADKVDLLGHSLGTAVSQTYLNSSPERAARVAHYVNIDGGTATALPGGVPTLAVWGEGNQSRQITGAENVYFPNQAHVQVATSAETFGEFYEFFRGRPPRTTDVVPERPDRVRVSGEANIYPANVGAAGSTLQVWEVDGDTGERIGRRPRATYQIGEDGAWGPFRADGRKRYEFAIVRDDRVHHFYFQPFMRSNHLVRLLTSEPGTGIDLLRETSPNHTTLTVVRYKEFWGDQGDQSDVVAINGENVLNAANTPRSKRANAMFAFDRGSDQVTDLATPIPGISGLPFITGIDVFMAAATPPDDTISVDITARQTDGIAEEINFPNWASDGNHVSVQFRDFEQEVERYRPRR